MCWFRVVLVFVGPKGEFLYEIRQTGDELERGLNQLDTKTIRGPSHHGSTLFRRNAYERCGGYRKEFFVAQDIDLWLKLNELGRCIASPNIGYEATWTPDSISSQNRSEQLHNGKLAISAAELRRNGHSDTYLLTATKKSPRKSVNRLLARKTNKAQGYYFIGSCIAGRDPKAAQNYFKKALRSWPFHLKAITRIVLNH